MNHGAMHKGRAMTIPGGALLGAVYALLWTLIASGLLGWLIQTEQLAEKSVGYGSMVILLTASMLGAGMAYRKVKHQRAIVCLTSGGIYLMLLLAVTALFFGGQYSGFGVTVFLIMGGSAATIFLGMERKRGRGRKIKIR